MQMADDEESPFESGKILVRDLAPNTTQDYLNRYFTQFGNVSEAIIPHNSVAGSPHSFGFVVFKQPFRIPFILQLPHCIHNRCVEVSRALKEEDLQTLESQRMTSTGDNFVRLGNFDNRRIHVQGPPRTGITDDEFLKYFQGFGNVIFCYFCNDLGDGHITFRIKRAADRVLYRRSCILNGKCLKVYGQKHLCLQDHYNNDAHNSNVSRAINIQEEAAASSGGDHVNGTKDMQPQAATSVSDTRNMQIFPAEASSGTDHINSTTDKQPQAATGVTNTRSIQIGSMQIVLAATSSGTDDVNSATDMQPQAVERISNTRSMQIGSMQIVLAAPSSGTDHVNSATDMQPHVVESVSNTRDMQIIPAAANSGPRHMQLNPAAAHFNPRNMQIIPAAAIFVPRNMQFIPAGASSGTGHIPWNNSSHTNFPPSDQRILHYRPQMNYMVPGVPELHYPGLRPAALNQAYNGMGIFINAANNFPRTVVASFPRNYPGFGNFPMALTDYADQDFNYYDNSNG